MPTAQTVFVIVCVVAYLITGHRSIYPSQRLIREKGGSRTLSRPVALRDWTRQAGEPGAGDHDDRSADPGGRETPE
jgi:hypothetical protein